MMGQIWTCWRMFLEDKMAAEKPFRLYPFQQRVFDTLLKQKRSVMVQAPTGLAKRERR